MTLLLAVALRSILTALVAWAVWGALHRRSAALRHGVICGGILASAAVVPLSMVTPRWELVRVPVEVSNVLASDTVPVNETPRTRPDPGRVRHPLAASLSPVFIVSTTWAAGAAAGLWLLLIRLRRLRQLTAAARPLTDGLWRSTCDRIARAYGITRPIDLRCLSTPGIVGTWGLTHPVVLVPAGADRWDASWIRVALGHELAHVQRHDWALQILGDIARALCWFNPVLWVLCSRLRRESEFACDDVVLRSGVPVGTYASHLVDIARACRGPSSPLLALPAAAPSTLHRRITMLFQIDCDRRRPTAGALTTILAGMMTIAAAMASVGVFAQASSGRLVGHVFDASGAVLPGVEVVLESAQQAKWPTMTDSAGRFEFTPVGVGRDTLSVAVPGFRTLRDEFELGASSRWNRSITLQVGELEETVTVTARRPPPSTSTARVSLEPVRVGNIRPPVKLASARPTYPASMREAGLEGVVPMEALVAADGTVSSVRVLSAQVHPDFAQAAEAAVRQWRFSQTLLNGVAVEVRMTVSVRFSLTD